jgi:hypothetical protein
MIMTFNTHAFIKKLTAAGMSEPLAEVVAEEQMRLVEDKLATKDDLNKLETDLRNEITIKCAEVKTELVKWMFGISAAQAVFLLSALKLLH